MDIDNFKINLNQNLWGLFLCLLTLGLSEYFCLDYLFWFGLVLSILSGLSFVVPLLAYTINYWQNKMTKKNQYGYNVRKFILEAKKKTYADLIQYCEEKLNWLDNIKFTPKSPLKDKEYEIRKYRDFIGEYLFFLRSGIKPSGMSEEDFKMTKEITIELVNKNNLKKEVLEVYN